MCVFINTMSVFNNTIYTNYVMPFKIVKTTQIEVLYQQNHNLQKCLRMLYYLYSTVIYIYY